MGVMSRRVVPACGSLCFFCPSLRSRSRQPVKRYKKFLADIFPRSQITEYLEQRCYKDLRHERFGSVKVVLLIYRKLLSSCKEQMPLFASSLLGIVRTLFEQTRQDEMQILGCSVLVDFINGQTESTYMFNLEGLIPKLCQFAREVGDHDRALKFRAAGMQTLAVLVSFMGEQSHMSMDFDHIIAVTLENYMDPAMKPENEKDGKQSQCSEQWVDGVLKAEEHSSSFPDLSKKFSSLPSLINTKVDTSTLDTAKSPSYWSRVCLHNIALLAKEATTIRRVLEPLFHSFDSENYWSPQNGLAHSVLLYLQALLEESGENSHILFSVVVKHLDHRDVIKQPDLQINIINIITTLAENAKQQVSPAIVGGISDLVKHLRKCMHNSAEQLSPGDGLDNGNYDIQSAIENCILQLSYKQVADVGPILDMMAVVLENIPTSTAAARATISAVYRTAQIISPIPNIKYYRKAFPDALFHHLLLAMAHTDHVTRAGAQHIFSTVLMPNQLSSHSRNNSFSILAQSPRKLPKDRTRSFSITDGNAVESGLRDGEMRGENPNMDVQQCASSRTVDQSVSFKGAVPNRKPELTSLRLSSLQVSLLLSSLWLQSTMTENTPVNFEAMAHTYKIALLFTRSKNSSHMALVRCFQLAFSLRSISLDKDGGLQPSRRRSLFTVASYMLICSARAWNIPELIPFVKSSLTDETVDPYLKLGEEIKVQASFTGPGGEVEGYGTPEDEVAALRSLCAIKSEDRQLKEIVISNLPTTYEKLSEDELSGMKKQLLQGFSPDEAYPAGTLFMETPYPSSPLVQIEFQNFDEVMDPALSTDEEALLDPSGSQSGRKSSLSINSLHVLSVNQLLESVLETARQVASFPVSSTPVPYDQVKNQCEALVTGKQEKMSVLQSFKLQQEAKAALELTEEVKPGSIVPVNGQNHLSCALESGQQSFRLPPSSPYDKFMKAARC
nr:protein EFR3 homolog isoform X1 [Ipomoea batatas]